MPIYEYQCGSCGHQLEAFQNISEPALSICPSCHNEALSKLVSATSFQLKGTGWYATDFRDKGKSPQKKEAQAAEKTETTTPSQTSTDSTAAS